MSVKHYSGRLPVFQMAKEEGVNCGGAKQGAWEQTFLGPCKRRAVQPWVGRKVPEVPGGRQEAQMYPSTPHLPPPPAPQPFLGFPEVRASPKCCCRRLVPCLVKGPEKKPLYPQSPYIPDCRRPGTVGGSSSTRNPSSGALGCGGTPIGICTQERQPGLWDTISPSAELCPPPSTTLLTSPAPGPQAYRALSTSHVPGAQGT